MAILVRKITQFQKNYMKIEQFLKKNIEHQVKWTKILKFNI